jgi:hypothetical protein
MEFPSFPSSDLGTVLWESKLELLRSCVPKLELGNKKKPPTGEPYAGDLHVRFAEARDSATCPSYPYLWTVQI